MSTPAHKRKVIAKPVTTPVKRLADVQVTRSGIKVIRLSEQKGKR